MIFGLEPALWVDIALAISMLEVVGRLAWRRRVAGLASGILHACAGLMLIAALRLGLTDPETPVWLACLALAGVCHAADLAVQWRGIRRA